MRKPKTTKIPFTLQLLRLTYNTFGRLFPVYFGNRAYEQWFTTIKFNTPSYELPALEAATKESIKVNGLPVAVYIWQDKKTKPNASLLFIHGWNGRGTQVANYIKKLNTIGYRVISFDGPAHGNTPGKQSSLLEMTDVVLALNKSYGGFDAAITHSFGGMILAFAMSQGLKLDRAALVCPPKDFQVIFDNFKRILALPDSVMQAVARKAFATHGQITQDLINTINNVKRLSCKGLVIHDEDDVDNPWRGGKEIADAWPGATFIKTRGLGHRRIIHDDRVIEHIIDFMSDVAK
ncbi:MAG: alpha/beta fold hydrolase [Gammaproteobacteria bacterium]